MTNEHALSRCSVKVQPPVENKQPRLRRGCFFAGDAGIEPDAREAQSAYQAVASTMLTSSMTSITLEAAAEPSMGHRFSPPNLDGFGPVSMTLLMD